MPWDFGELRSGVSARSPLRLVNNLRDLHGEGRHVSAGRRPEDGNYQG